MSEHKTKRILAIDAFRALTMFLMIFVNDLWTLEDYPEWLGHRQAWEDGMGLADVVFPAFLFIVGLSIPFATDNRFRKGQTKLRIFGHILQRSFALIVMGFYMVNLENINVALLPFSKYYWQLIMALALFFIWTDYLKKDGAERSGKRVIIALGIFLLAFLAWVYVGGTTDEPVWMKPYWWGILGLIGWAYLLNASLYLLIGNRFIWLVVLVVFLHILNLQEFIRSDAWPGVKLIVSASNHACVAAGMLASSVLMKLKEKGMINNYFWALLGLAMVFIIYGFALRPAWGISKIRATPSWTAICSGISFASLALIYAITDIWRWRGWFNWIRPAGTSTLTCYLVPYFYYAILGISAFYLPLVLRTGATGVVKSLIFAFLIIQITGLLEKFNVRLKI